MTRNPAVQKPSRLNPQGVQPRVVLSGYYGFDNLGDELILHVLVEQFKRRQLHVTVLSNNPGHTRRQYGVEAVHRYDLMAVMRAVSDAHLFVSGGGGLFQDVTGPMSVFYYGGLIFLARFFEVPAAVFGQGLGPLRSGLSRLITRKALNSATLVTLRDEASVQLAETLSGERPHLTLDPVWLLDLSAQARQAQAAETPETPWRIGISLRPWSELGEDRLEGFAMFLKRLVCQSTRPVEFVLLPFQGREDEDVLYKLASYLKRHEAGAWRMVRQDAVLETIPQCHLLFGMRFHSLLLGILADVAVFGLVYDPKVRQLLQMLGLQGVDISLMEHLDEGHVQDYFNHYPMLNLDVLRRRAYRNFEILDELIGQLNLGEFLFESPEPPDWAAGLPAAEAANPPA